MTESVCRHETTLALSPFLHFIEFSQATDELTGINSRASPAYCNFFFDLGPILTATCHTCPLPQKPRATSRSEWWLELGLALTHGPFILKSEWELEL